MQDKIKIDNLIKEIYAKGQQECVAEKQSIDPFKPYIYPFQVVSNNYYVKFTLSDKTTFYAYFQPCFNKKAPLLIHTPGYGGEMSIHPELSDMYNVMHINPLGYTTSNGKDYEKLTCGGVGSVLPDTILSNGKSGYFDWLVCCVAAIEWAKKLSIVMPDRLSFFGTSQGGFGSLILSAIYDGKGTRCVAADQPFLTDYKLANMRGAYCIGLDNYKHLSAQQIQNTMFYFDTVNYIHKFNFPVLLTSGGKDDTCPPETIKSLFNKLNGTFSYTHFSHLAHGYNKEFIELCKAWFKIYA